MSSDVIAIDEPRSPNYTVERVMMSSHNRTSEELAISKAVLHAGARLGLTNEIIARAIGISASSVSRMRRGHYWLIRDNKPFELAALLVRLVGVLDGIVNGDENAARSWLRSDNAALGDAPIYKIQSIAGLADTIAYLEARHSLV